MRRTVVAALHSTGYSRPSPFSCLVVDELLLVLLLSQYKVLPMGTQVFHGYLALVIVLDLPPQKMMDKLDYYGSFIDFAHIE
jgi:hypothetical protein